MQLPTGEARHRGAPDGSGRGAASLDVAHLRTCAAQQARSRADLRRAAQPSVLLAHAPPAPIGGVAAEAAGASPAGQRPVRPAAVQLVAEVLAVRQ
eukprot:6562554-Pyramimonas_sp.AAC.1